MNCTSCGHKNRDAAKFCEECAFPLARHCANCQAELRPGAKFCDQCASPADAPAAANSEPAPERDPRSYTPKHLAEKILTSRSALEGERKQVTVLFVDVKGSMELAEQLDPEEWHRTLERFFELLTEGVHRFEGSVNQYTGDGIMALFGAPIAHEDHAQRACYAALALRDEIGRYADELRRTQGLNFSARMGINSGEVVVGKIGDDLRMDYTAQGHTVGLAQRVEQLAAPDTAYLTEGTARLVEGFFRLRDLGPFELKGVNEPLAIYELEAPGAARTRLDVSRHRGLTRFVGRRDEMALLDAALNRAREGHGAVVGVVGEAGVGKSRLCLEFVERCRAQGIPIYEAHCPSHGKNVPFLPMLELFRSFFGITDQDTPDDARQKVAGALVLLDPALQDTLSVLLDFLGIGDPDRIAPHVDADARQRQLFALIHRVTQAQTERGQVAVLLVDDVHWIDAGSDAFLAQLVAAAEQSRRLVLLNFRPEYEAEWTARSHYQQLPLVPLDPDAVRELAESLLGDDASVRALPERLEGWTGGNPFFTEEVIQTLIETGQLEGSPGAYRLTKETRQLEVPSSVQALLAARIDRLPEDARHVLRNAAVIGREFSGPVLEAIADLPAAELGAALERLKSGDFLYERSLYPVTEYAFKHPLTHEVAYTSQLQDRRIRTHAAVARAIEAQESERLEERAALIAHHWEQAVEPSQAVHWHQRAATWSGVSDVLASLRHWSRVRELVAELPPETATLSLGARACAQFLSLGWRRGESEQEAAKSFEQGKDLAERAGDLALLAAINGAYGAHRGINLGYVEDYLTYAKEAQKVAQQAGNRELEIAMNGYIAYGLTFTSSVQELLPFVDERIESTPDDPSLGSEHTGFSPFLSLVLMKGVGHYLEGRLAEAEHWLREATRRANAEGFPEMATWGNGFLCIHGIRSGNPRDALHYARAAFEVAERVATDFGRFWAHFSMGQGHLANGAVREALEFLETSLEISDEGRIGGLHRSWVSGTLAKALLQDGRVEEARRCGEESVEFARSRALRWTPEPWVALARASIAQHDGETARTTLDELQDLIDVTGANLYRPELHELRAEYTRAFGTKADARAELREAHRLYTEMGAIGHAQRLAGAL